MTAVFAFLFMLLVVGAMSLGVMFGRQPIAGSCGGLKTLGIAGECEICGGDPNRCESNDPTGLGVDAIRGEVTRDGE